MDKTSSQNKEQSKKMNHRLQRGAKQSFNQPQRKKKFSNRTFWYVIFLLAWAALSLIASQFIIAFLMILPLGDRIVEPLWTAVYDFLVYAFALVLVVWIPPRFAKLLEHHKTTLKSQKATTTPVSAGDSQNSYETQLVKDLTTNTEELGVNKWPTFTDLGLVPIGYVVYIFLANLATNLMQAFPWFDAEETQDVGFNGLMNGSDRFFAMLALVFIAPIVEELVMRGWLYGKLRAKLNFIPSILLTSLLFAVLHGQWNVGVTVFFLSLVLCSLREITGSVWSGILLHMLNNGVAFYILYVLML